MRYSRRDFVQRSASLLAGAGFSLLPGEALHAARRRVPPSDRIRVGAIGINGRGWRVLGEHLKDPQVDAVALCDVDRNVLERRAAELQGMTGRKAALHGDYRALLDDREIDVVIIATPDHWHCLQMIGAVQAGKDVYCEKPLANSIGESARMVAAARRSGRVVQVGQWQRSAPHFQAAVDFVRSGALGRIRMVRAWANWGEIPPPRPDGPVPPGVDYDMWLGPAPARPFNPNRFHRSFRWFWDYAGGLMTDWGVHLIDTVLAAMEVGAPRSVVSIGGNFAQPEGPMETPDTQSAAYDYGDFMLVWEHALEQDRTHGISFVGSNGTLAIDREGWQVVPRLQGDKPLMQAVPRQPAEGDGSLLHALNFLECVRSRREPNCGVEAGHRAALNAHLGNIALRVGRKIHWDAAAGRISGDAEANALLEPSYRAPWSLPRV